MGAFIKTDVATVSPVLRYTGLQKRGVLTAGTFKGIFRATGLLPAMGRCPEPPSAPPFAGYWPLIDQFQQPAALPYPLNRQRRRWQKRDPPACGARRRLPEISGIPLSSPPSEGETDAATAFSRELQPARSRHGQATDFGDHRAQARMTQSFLETGQHVTIDHVEYRCRRDRDGRDGTAPPAYPSGQRR